MAFQPPAFVLSVNLWRNAGVGGLYVAPNLVFNAALSCGRRVTEKNVTGATPSVASTQMVELLCPKGTDVRSTWNNVANDLVEVPAGSKRFYDIWWVDDVGKGFSNEYRLCTMLFRINSGGGGAAFGFPVPTPLP